MRRPVARHLVALTILLFGWTAACSDDEPAGLDPLALEEADLPDGFSTSDTVDDTITAFCVNEDATAGLRASDRAVRGFTRSPAGASVIQLVFRFEDDGAARFVNQARAILERCNEVPDIGGLAFTYDELGTGLDEAVAAIADDHVGRHGTSVGSGDLTIDLLVFHHGDVGQLVAVLGLDLPRAELDDLARTAFEAAAAKAQAEAE